MKEHNTDTKHALMALGLVLALVWALGASIALNRAQQASKEPTTTREAMLELSAYGRGYDDGLADRKRGTVWQG